MQLSPDDIMAFKSITEAELGESLSLEQAESMAKEVVALYGAILTGTTAPKSHSKRSSCS